MDELIFGELMQADGIFIHNNPSGGPHEAAGVIYKDESNKLKFKGDPVKASNILHNDARNAYSRGEVNHSIPLAGGNVNFLFKPTGLSLDVKDFILDDSMLGFLNVLSETENCKQ